MVARIRWLALMASLAQIITTPFSIVTVMTSYRAMPAMIFWYQVLAGMTDSSTRNFLNNKASPFVDIIEVRRTGLRFGYVCVYVEGWLWNSLGEQGAPGGDVIHTAGGIVFADGRNHLDLREDSKQCSWRTWTLGPTVDAIDAGFSE